MFLYYNLWLLSGYCIEASLCHVKNSNAFTILPVDIVIINHNAKCDMRLIPLFGYWSLVPGWFPVH